MGHRQPSHKAVAVERRRWTALRGHHRYDSHIQLTAHLRDFIDAYDYGRRLKTLRGLTPYEYVCKIWETEPERFILNPQHQMPGLNT
jgi:hypothetical protein